MCPAHTRCAREQLRLYVQGILYVYFIGLYARERARANRQVKRFLICARFPRVCRT
eukprot:SAG31_NODE_47_length_30979_cov_41.708841_19_plen_56_part_00